MERCGWGDERLDAGLNLAWGVAVSEKGVKAMMRRRMRVRPLTFTLAPSLTS